MWIFITVQFVTQSSVCRKNKRNVFSWHTKEKERCSTIVPTTELLTFCCVWSQLLPDSLFYEQSRCSKILVCSVILQNGRVSSESSDDPDRWQSIFAAVTDRELRLYESAPWSPEAWSAPVDTCPLLSTRLECYHILITKLCILQLSWYFLQVDINTHDNLILFLLDIGYYRVQGSRTILSIMITPTPCIVIHHKE